MVFQTLHKSVGIFRINTQSRYSEIVGKAVQNTKEVATGVDKKLGTKVNKGLSKTKKPRVKKFLNKNRRGVLYTIYNLI